MYGTAAPKILFRGTCRVVAMVSFENVGYSRRIDRGTGTTFLL